MTEVEKLEQRLKKMYENGMKAFRIIPGENKNATPEQIAAELNRVLDQIEAGNLEEVFDLEYGLKFNSHEECREFYNNYPEPTWNMNDKNSKNTYLERLKMYEANLPKFHKEWMEGKKEHKEMTELGY